MVSMGVVVLGLFVMKWSIFSLNGLSALFCTFSVHSSDSGIHSFLLELGFLLLGEALLFLCFFSA